MMSVLATDAVAVSALDVVVMTLGIIGGALSHWRFRTGWHMREGWLKPSEAFFPTYVCLMYATLPATIGWASMMLLLWLPHLVQVQPHTPMGYVFILLLMSLFASAIWAAKEFFAPTMRRTPPWLLDESDD